MTTASSASTVCVLPGRGVSARSSVNDGPFATTAHERLQILERYRRIAMVGLSSNPYRPSHFAALYLVSVGYDVIPVNPRAGEILGRPCYPSLRDIPGPVEVVDIFRDPEAVPASSKRRSRLVPLSFGCSLGSSTRRRLSALANKDCRWS